MKPLKRQYTGVMKPGQDLVIAGHVGRAGARIIAGARKEELSRWFSGDIIEQIQTEDEVILTGDLKQWEEYGATECEPIAEGGVFTALWNLSGAYRVGIEFQLLLIPIQQMTIEICERYDLNPYRLYSENCVLLVGDNGGHLVEALQERSIPAAVIGRVNAGIKREIYYGRLPAPAFGGKSREGRGFLDRPKRDELYQKVPDYVIST